MSVFLSHIAIAHLLCRPSSQASQLTPDTIGAPAPTHGKVFWVGCHRHWTDLQGRKWGPPLGRIQHVIGPYLQSLGWTRVSEDTSAIPVFSFMSRKGSDFGVQSGPWPLVRQLPHSHTLAWDDKLLLWEHLSQAGHAASLPPTVPAVHWAHWLGTERATDQLRGTDAGGVCDRGSTPTRTPPASPDPALGPGPSTASSSHQRLFLKHRLGANGNSVHAYGPSQLPLLRQRLERMTAADLGQYLLQEEVYPPMLVEGRKFVLRVHVLLTVEATPAHTPIPVEVLVPGPSHTPSPPLDPGPLPCSTADPGSGPGPEAGTPSGPRWAAHVHTGSVLVLPHALPYDPHDHQKAAWVSCNTPAQRQRPDPYPLQALPGLWDTTWPQIQRIVAESVSSVHPHLPPIPCPNHSQLYQVMGYDFMLQEDGTALLLEVNAYPSIAGGAVLSRAEAHYHQLLVDLIQTVVLPVTDRDTVVNAHAPSWPISSTTPMHTPTPNQTPTSDPPSPPTFSPTPGPRAGGPPGRGPRPTSPPQLVPPPLVPCLTPRKAGTTPQHPAPICCPSLMKGAPQPQA